MRFSGLRATRVLGDGRPLYGLPTSLPRGAPSRYASIDEMCCALRQAGFSISARRLLDADETVAQPKIGERMHGLIVATMGVVR